MARFADYLDSDYLPGEVRRGVYGDASPFSALEYELNKRVKFKPKSDIAGKYLEEFMQLYQNPNALAERDMRLPGDFVGFSQMIG